MHPDEARHDVEHALAGAVRDVGLELRPVVDQVAAAARGAKRLLGRRVRRCQPNRRLGRVAAVVAEPAGDPAGDVAVVERERALDAGAEDRDVVAVGTRRLGDRVEVEERGDQHALAALGGGDDRARAVRRRHGQRRRADREVLARRVAEVEALDPHAEPLAAEGDASGDGERPRVLDLGRTQHALVAGRERLADRRRGTDHVDHDARRGGGELVRSEGDVNVHVATLAVHVRHATLLPPSGPRDPRLVLGVRPADLRGLHDVRAGRDPLPGPRERRRGQAVARPHDPERAADDTLHRGARDDGADRDQRRRLRDHRRAGRRDQPPGREAVLGLGSPGRSPSRTATGGGS